MLGPYVATAGEDYDILRVGALRGVVCMINSWEYFFMGFMKGKKQKILLPFVPDNSKTCICVKQNEAVFPWESLSV